MKREEFERYLKQARHTLESAERDAREGDFDWACFKAQQAAELILKGWLRASGIWATGHSVLALLEKASELAEVPPEILDCARELDKVYTPSRYPDVYTWGAPVDYYTERDARFHLDCARRILDFVLCEAKCEP